MTDWTVEEMQKSFVLLYNNLLQERSHLNYLDSEIGDGDHGDTMCAGFKAVVYSIKGNSYRSLGECINQAANAFIENTGGAIGPILGSFFAEGTIVWSDIQVAFADDWKSFLIRGLEGVEEIGGAEPGEKTLVDALTPAVQAFTSEADKGEDLASCFKAAADAAIKGARSTENMVAQKGRARFLHKRDLGSRDAGAETITIIFKSWYQQCASGYEETGAEESISVNRKGASAKFINLSEDMIREELEGFTLAFHGHVMMKYPGVVTRAHRKEKGKVALCIGHGGGHSPSMTGFVGAGLLDAAVVGNLFTCAAGTRIATGIEEVDGGAGVLLLISNHSGDLLNARLARRLAESKGIKVLPVLHYDDISTAPPDKRSQRRGLGGLLFAVAVGGAAAEDGLPIQEVAALTEKTRDRTATVAVATRAPLHPISGKPLFDLPPGMMEVGMGVHGEKGSYRGSYLSANETMDLIASSLLEDLNICAGEEILVLLNGSGGISFMELHILYRRLSQVLSEKEICVYDKVIGEYFTTFEMGGFSLSLCKVDQELKGWWDKPSSGVYFKKY